MKDPRPENIGGQKRVVHKYEHRIDWGYVIAGVGGLAVAYVLFRLFADASDTDDDGDLVNS